MPENKILVAKSFDELSGEAAELIASASQEAIARSGRFTIALSGGETPKKLYELLATPQWRNRIDWTKVHAFWGDERVVMPDDPKSNYKMANDALLSKVPIPAANVHRVKTEIKDVQTVANDYEAEIYRVLGGQPPAPPRFDFVLLGMGDNAHTASLFPHSEAVRPSDHIVMALYVPEVSNYRITFTAPLINQADKIVFLISGAKKASVLREVLYGPRDPERLPSQLIQPSQGALYWLIDEAAAVQLPRKTA